MYRNNKKYFKNYNNLNFENVLIETRRQEIISFLKKKKPKNILEIGCGNESICHYYKSYKNFLVLEPSTYFITKNNFSRIKNKGLKIYNSFLEDFKNDKNINFDFIICSSVLHETKSPKIFLRKIYNLSKKKTIIFFNVPNAFSLHRLLAVESGFIKNPFTRSKTQKKMQQKKVYSIETLTKELRNEGFSVILGKTNFLKPFTYDQMHKIIKNKIVPKQVLTGMKKIIKLLPNFGAEINIYAKKR
jgi:SAM-dependent methyltransferase